MLEKWKNTGREEKESWVISRGPVGQNRRRRKRAQGEGENGQGYLL